MQHVLTSQLQGVALPEMHIKAIKSISIAGKFASSQVFLLMSSFQTQKMSGENHIFHPSGNWIFISLERIQADTLLNALIHPEQ